MTQTSRFKIILTVAAGLFLLAAALMIIQGQQPTVSAPDTERDSAQSSAPQVQVLKVQRRDITPDPDSAGKYLSLVPSDVVRQGLRLCQMDRLR